jgi:hypothetical protein
MSVSVGYTPSILAQYRRCVCALALKKCFPIRRGGRAVTLDPDPFHLVERDLVLGAIVQLRGSGRLVRSDLLRMLKRPAILHVGRNAGRAKCVTAGGVATVSDVKQCR